MDVSHLLQSSSYWWVFLFTAVEGVGIPFPPARLFTLAAIYAGTTHHLSLPLLLGAAVGGTLAGNLVGFWGGRKAGERLLRRADRLLPSFARRLVRGQEVFRRYGGGVVCVGHFVPLLDLWIALLAGAGAMRWRAFLLWNTLGVCGWALLYGGGGYLLGDAITRVGAVMGGALLVLMLLGLLGGRVMLRRYEKRRRQREEGTLQESSGDPSTLSRR